VEKATPIQMRQSLEVVVGLKKAGIRFVPMPVKNNDDFEMLVRDLSERLEYIEKKQE